MKRIETIDSLMSFDTVILKKGYDALDSGYWRDVGFTSAQNGRLVRNCELGCMTVHPNGYQKKDWLMVQASLPKIVFGHNARLPNQRQAREAASWLCGYVSAETGLVFTVDDVKAFRIDYTRDYDIREDQTHAIALALLATDLPNFHHARREKDSVYFARGRGRDVTKAIAIYPKSVWATDTNQSSEVQDESRGKLRLEVRLIRKGLTGIKGARKPLDYLSESISDSLLNEAATMLKLPQIIDARDIDFHERIIVHGCRHQTLGNYGLPTFLELVKRYGPQFHRKPGFYYAKSTYYKRRSELEQLGIWQDLVAASDAQSPYE